MKMIETDKQQEKRRGFTPRLILNLAPLPEIPYGNYGNRSAFVLVGAFEETKITEIAL